MKNQKILLSLTCLLLSSTVAEGGVIKQQSENELPEKGEISRKRKLPDEEKTSKKRKLNAEYKVEPSLKNISVGNNKTTEKTKNKIQKACELREHEGDIKIKNFTISSYPPSKQPRSNQGITDMLLGPFVKKIVDYLYPEKNNIIKIDAKIDFDILGKAYFLKPQSMGMDVIFKWLCEAKVLANIAGLNPKGYYFDSPVYPRFNETIVNYLMHEDVADAQFKLGLIYKFYDKPTNFVEAIRWYHKAAAQNVVGAQMGLGNCYKDGKGVLQDYQEAIKWYSKANYSSAHLEIARLYESGGNNIKKDPDQAMYYYKIAADAGNLDALKRLADIYLKGELGRSQDLIMARHYTLQAANQGDIESMSKMADFFGRGLGNQDPNPEEAQKWVDKVIEKLSQS